MRRAWLALLAGTALFAYKEGGPYLGVGAANASFEDKGFYRIETARKSTPPIFCAGAYINENFSVEMEFLPSVRFQTTGGNTLRWSVFDVNAQAHYPFYHDKLDIFAKFGAGQVAYESKGATLLYGVGVGYRYDARYGVRAGYDYFDFGVDTNGDDAKDIQMHIGAFYGVFEVRF